MELLGTDDVLKLDVAKRVGVGSGQLGRGLKRVIFK